MNKLISLKHLAKTLQKSSSVPINNSHHLIKPFHSVSKPPTIHPPNINLLSPHQQCHFPKSYGGIFTNSLMSKHLSTFAHLKTPINSFVGPRILLFKNHLQKFKGSSWSSGQKRGWSSWSQGYSADNVVVGLVLANAAVFILWRVLDHDFMYENFTISVDNLKSGRIHTLITSAFSHIAFDHIGHNMLGLYFFGSSLGRMFGPEYVLKLYFAGAVVGSIFFVVHHAFLANMFQKKGAFHKDLSRTPGLGASGAVNALMLLDIFLFPKATIMLNFFIPIPAVLLGIYVIGHDILRIIEGDEGVSGAAHMGGAAVAAAAWLRLKKGRGFRL